MLWWSVPWRSLKAKVRERFIYRIFELSQKDGVLQIETGPLKVKVFPKLKRLWAGVVIFAATLGTEADQMIRRASVGGDGKGSGLTALAVRRRFWRSTATTRQEEIAKELSWVRAGI